MSKRTRKRFNNILVDICLIIIFAFLLFPIIWVIGMSFKTTDQILSWPPTFTFVPTLENYASVLFSRIEVEGVGTIQTQFMRSFLNTLIISGGAVLVSVLIGVPAAYALARYNFPGKENIAFTFLSFRFGPELLVVVPIFLIFQRLGLYNTYYGLIWVYQLITLPMIIWIMRSYFEDIPQDFENACMVDGYPQWRAFIRIVLPLVRPGIAASALLAFIYAWNNFIFALILGSEEVAPVTIEALKFISAEALRYGILSAGVVISFLPILIFSIFAQRYFVRGLSMGAIKR